MVFWRGADHVFEVIVVYSAWFRDRGAQGADAFRKYLTLGVEGKLFFVF